MFSFWWVYSQRVFKSIVHPCMYSLTAKLLYLEEVHADLEERHEDIDEGQLIRHGQGEKDDKDNEDDQDNEDDEDDEDDEYAEPLGKP